jgi:hypothetical protein
MPNFSRRPARSATQGAPNPVGLPHGLLEGAEILAVGRESLVGFLMPFFVNWLVVEYGSR